jgi:integrase
VASIIPIGGRWRAQVRRKGHRTATRTFDTRREAEQWARKIEASIDQGRPALAAEAMTVATLVSQYRRMREDLGRPVDPASNTHYMLAHLAEDLGDVRIHDLTPQRLAQWARERSKQGAGGYTVNMELSALGTAVRHTASFLGIQLPDVVGAARPLLHYGQLISGGNRRTRRPTEDELQRLLAALEARNPVVADAVRVASITGLRRSELTRIAWADIDELRRAVLVRHRKHPRRRAAKDEWVPLLGDAWVIVQRQPRESERIFPVSPETLTDSVTAATRALGIPDLRLHDMRREANSALRERGFDDVSRQAVLGHATSAMNDRYVAITLEGLHQQYAGADSPDTPPRPPRRRKAGGRQS